jgi:hypothetical protein
MDIVFKHLKELLKQSDLKDVIGRFYGILSGKFVDRFLKKHIIIKTLECKSKEEFSNSYKTMNNNFIVAIIDKQKNILNNILQDDYFKGPPTVNITNNGNTIPWNPDISGIEMDRVTQENKVTDYDLKDSNGNRIVQVQRKGNEILVSKINTKTHAIEITATPIKQDNTNPVDMKKFSEEEYNNMAIRVSAINLMRYADINHIDNIKSLNYMTIYKAKDYVLSHINTELINNIEVEVDSILCPGDANVRPALSCFLSKYDKNIVICPRPSGNDINIVYITFKNGNKFIIVIVGNKHRSVIVDASTNMPDIIDKVIKAMRTLNYKDLFKEKQVKSFKNLWGLISDD